MTGAEKMLVGLALDREQLREWLDRKPPPKNARPAPEPNVTTADGGSPF